MAIDWLLVQMSHTLFGWEDYDEAGYYAWIAMPLSKHYKL